MKIDKKEKCIFYRRKFKKVTKILMQEFQEDFFKIGMNQIIWQRKKELLKELYNIDWKTPAELNPHIIFD